MLNMDVPDIYISKDFSCYIDLRVKLPFSVLLFIALLVFVEHKIR